MDTEIENAFVKCVADVANFLDGNRYRRTQLVFRQIFADGCKIIQFQRSAANTPSMIRFTLNLGVAYSLLLPHGRSLAKITAFDCPLRVRIGFFLVPPKDKWWTIGSVTEVRETHSDEINHLLGTLGLPFLDRYAQISNLETLWESGQSPGLTDKEREMNLRELVASRSKR